MNNFHKKRVNSNFIAKRQNQMGFYEKMSFNAKITLFRKKVAPISQWKYVGEKEGATFFVLPNNMKIVVKPIFDPLPSNKIGRKNKVMDYSKVLEKVISKKIRFEVPLGRIKTNDGRWYYVTKAVKGKSMVDWLKTASMIDGIKVAQNMGDYLSKMHKKGVSHLEPSPHNWIIDGIKPTLIDTKYITFKEEYAAKNSWEVHLNNCAKKTVNWLPKKLHPFFWEKYNLNIIQTFK
jgi:hypothetical protein